MIGLQIGLEMSVLPPRGAAPVVTARLRDLIAAGRWSPQEALPPERRLAAELGCSRETLRRALSALASEGLIWRHQGKGTFLGSAPSGGTLAAPVPLQQLLEIASPHDLIEARLIFEPALAAAAALAADGAAIKAMRQLARATGTAADWRDYEKHDDAFHKAIARASGNALLSGIYAHLVTMRGRARWQRHHDAVFRKARRLEYATEQSALHLAIVEAIAAGDPQAARQAMHDHLAAIRALLRAADNPERGTRNEFFIT
ncbi:FadR/GntR family transcriptional regulator [Paracoccus cavernae]|uniref:FadR/GntR family transcriptional regulator n=1 Tax=Paracoccus cavernae TaxID=1571207 RepID=UPI0035F4D647